LSTKNVRRGHFGGFGGQVGNPARIPAIIEFTHVSDDNKDIESSTDGHRNVALSQERHDRDIRGTVDTVLKSILYVHGDVDEKCFLS
jgi:hypothetical protein